MAEKLDTYDFSDARAYRLRSQFADYVDGGIYRVRIGHDVTYATASSARQAFYRAAKRAGRFGKIHQEADDVLVVQAVEHEGGE